MTDQTPAPTPEQQQVLEAFATGRHVAISAGAGAGKTTTLRMLAAARPNTRMLYIAFNRAVAAEAKASFPRNVECRTAHSLAFAAVGRPFADRLNTRNIPPWELADDWDVPSIRVEAPRVDTDPDQPVEAAPVPDGEAMLLSGAQQIAAARAAVRHFVGSVDPKLTVKHVWDSDLPTVPAGADRRELRKAVLALAERLWADASQPGGQLKVTPDHYLKLWGLSAPNLTRQWSTILYDEAQDADPIVAQVVARQGKLGAQIVAVGDSAQAIYGWRGSADVLHTLPGAVECALQQSFRFGAAIADFANGILDRLDTPLRLVGRPDLNSTVRTSIDNPDAVLCRTNAGAIGQVIAHQAAGRRVALVGGGKDIAFFAKEVEVLRTGGPVSHQELAAFSSWREVVTYAETEDGQDLRILVRLIAAHGTAPLLQAINQLVDEKAADITVSTAHKAKGREWVRVQLADDYRAPTEKDPEAGLSDEELMLAYVSATRAKQALGLGGLAWLRTHAAVAQPVVAPTPTPDATPDGKATAPLDDREGLDLDFDELDLPAPAYSENFSVDFEEAVF